MKKQSGQSLVELVVALLLVGVSLTAVVGLVTKSIANNTFNRNKTLATSASSETLEWLRSERDKGWTIFYPTVTNSSSVGATVVWCMPTLSFATPAHAGACSSGNSADFISGTTFLRNTSIKNVDASTVNATVTVIWTDTQGTHTSESSTVFSNWKGNP